MMKLALFTVAALATSARAESVSITVSPLHMFVPMAEVTAELRVADKVGVSVIGGIGTFHDEATDQRISLFEGGASGRYYVTGSFHGGLQIGAEAVYVKAQTDLDMPDVKAAGLGLSPFLGYKWTHSSGFTLEGQVGATFMTLRAESTTDSKSDKAIGPMLNLQLGYSF